MPNVFWITGLSAAGKTTLAKLLADHLRSEGKSVVMLDGDELRFALDITSNHGIEDRMKLAFKYSRLAKLFVLQDINVVVGTVALFKDVHTWNRKNIPGYFEVYLKVPISVLRRRDPKKIYERFYNGELKEVAGLDIPFDEPRNPDLVISYYDGLSPKKSLQLVLKKFEKNN